MKQASLPGRQQPPSLPQQGWAAVLDDAWQGRSRPVVGVMNLESPLELEDSLKGRICDPFSEIGSSRE